MAPLIDGPVSRDFKPLAFRGNADFSRLGRAGVSPRMTELGRQAPRGACVAWGLPFQVDRPLVAAKGPVTVKLPATRAPWLVVLHAADFYLLPTTGDGFIRPMRGEGGLGDTAARYVWLYADGREEPVEIRRRFHIGAIERRWGENCFECVADAKPRPMHHHSSELVPNWQWGHIQVRVDPADVWPWTNWLWAWENPRPRAALVGLRVEPVGGPVVISGLSAGKASSHPLRWGTRRKAVLTLPAGATFEPRVDAVGRYRDIQLDMGQVIHATPRTVYPDPRWAQSHANQVPAVSPREVLVEYAAHPDARFHLAQGRPVAVAALEGSDRAGALRPVAPASQRVTIRVVDKASGKPVAVKLHLHGQAGEYLAPVDRSSIVNGDFFQDYSVDFTHQGIHHCTYINGQTTVELPLGRVYLEITRGFEVRPIRRVLRVTRATGQVVIELDRVLPWRQAGWVSADTHVHFLSPGTAQVEGAGEGLNVVNVLVTQWGESVVGIGDFDGRTTHGAVEAGGDGEHLVRVGSENRQHVLGHISLLGYNGPLIAPMCTGGADEGTMGDAVDALLTEWARQCRRQGGVVVMPHYPSPRGEFAASIVSGAVDAVEMCSWTTYGRTYGGIDPYSLSDWYRFLNCGYFVAAVGGTDKMNAQTAVGTIRTYARLAPDRPFDYEAWKDAIRRGETFATYGPLMEFAVEGKPAGTRMKLPATGGTLDVTWHAASVTIPMTRVELVVNGEIRHSQAVDPREAAGHWSVKLDRSSWLALLIRGRQGDRPEVIAAHSSPVMVDVAGTEFLAAADALTILEQIEGAMAFIDTLATRAATARHKQMRMILTAAHRSLHNRMHRAGHYHQHNSMQNHREHHQ